MFNKLSSTKKYPQVLICYASGNKLTYYSGYIVRSSPQTETIFVPDLDPNGTLLFADAKLPKYAQEGKRVFFASSKTIYCFDPADNTAFPTPASLKAALDSELIYRVQFSAQRLRQPSQKPLIILSLIIFLLALALLITCSTPTAVATGI